MITNIKEVVQSKSNKVVKLSRTDIMLHTTYVIAGNCRLLCKHGTMKSAKRTLAYQLIGYEVNECSLRMVVAYNMAMSARTKADFELCCDLLANACYEALTVKDVPVQVKSCSKLSTGKTVTLTKSRFDTLNESLASRDWPDLIALWPLGLNINYGETGETVQDGRFISVCRDNNGMYEAPITYKV